MKKSLIVFLVLVLINPALHAQQISQPVNEGYLKNGPSIYTLKITGEDPGIKDQEFYLNRSRNQRIVGWTTLGAGVLLSGIGLLVASNSSDDIYDDSDETTAGVLLLTGAVSGIVSIPFMIMASVNKHKAKLMMNNQKTGYGAPPHISRNIPGLTLSFQLGN